MGEETYLVTACADGAGSAAHADAGAQLACDAVIRTIVADLEGGLKIEGIQKEDFQRWYSQVRASLGVEAKARNTELRELACTLLTAVIGEKYAAFAQLGDGAIVVGEGDGYQAVFWPQNGEYANTTNFVTGQNFAEQLVVALREGTVDELALLTDGLQMLALDFAQKRAHSPFFSTLFKAIREAECTDDLNIPLREFLNSQRVNDRTDDDKTLFLATRRTFHAAQDAL